MDDHLSNWHSTAVYEEAAVIDVSSGAVVWHWLCKVLAGVGLQERTS